MAGDGAHLLHGWPVRVYPTPLTLAGHDMLDILLQAVLPIPGVFSVAVRMCVPRSAQLLMRVASGRPGSRQWLAGQWHVSTCNMVAPVDVISQYVSALLQGLVSATVLMAVVAVANIYTNDILLWQAHAVRRHDYETLAEAVGGRLWKVGECIAAMIVRVAITSSQLAHILSSVPFASIASGARFHDKPTIILAIPQFITEVGLVILMVGTLISGIQQIGEAHVLVSRLPHALISAVVTVLVVHISLEYDPA